MNEDDLPERLRQWGAGSEITEEAAVEIASLRKLLDESDERIAVFMTIISAWERKFPEYVYRHQTESVSAA